MPLCDVPGTQAIIRNRKHIGMLDSYQMLLLMLLFYWEYTRVLFESKGLYYDSCLLNNVEGGIIKRPKNHFGLPLSAYF